jgi:hypothetical protein
MWKWLLLSGAVVLVVYLYFSREHMTNRDLLSALKEYGDKDPKKQKNDPSKKDELPIMGPKAEIDPADKKKKEASKGTNLSGVYPDIYGPDVPKIPGTKQTAGKTVSDEPNDETYEFNPDLKNAFPVEGPPQPFLTDFSKFQH